VVQTDASVNPGNSGGVLVDIHGRLIGVPSAMIAQATGAAGIGFAIPSAIVEQVVPVLIQDGEYRHPWLGVQVASMTPSIAAALDLPADQLGARILHVTPGSPAAEAGLRGGIRTIFVDGQEMEVGGDVIVAIDGHEVRDTTELITYQVRETSVDQTVTLTVLRDGEPLDIDVAMGARP
jgi:serine protease Do